MMTGGWFLYDYIHNVKKHKDVKHIIGCELYISETRDALMEWLPNAQEDCPDKNDRANKRTLLAKKYHQIVLCKNKTGYENAVKIHNDAWSNGFYHSPTTTKEMIFSHHEGLIVTTTCLASLWSQKIMKGDLAGAERELLEWKEVFGEDIYVELQPTKYKTQALVNVELINLARKTNTQMIVTNDVHYISQEDHQLHFTLLNLGKLKDGLNNPEVKQKLWEFEVDDLYIKSLDQMKQGWKDNHKSAIFTESVFEETIHTIGDIISKVEHYSLESDQLLPQVDEMDPLEKLKLDTVTGFTNKIKKGVIPKVRLAEYQDRIIEELNVISALKAENYINICAMMNNWCKDNNIGTGPGRGSAGGSLVLYLLGVTDIDPIFHNLLFSRFLNLNRRPKLMM
jgi:DNA polymerase-3 subunit alpha